MTGWLIITLAWIVTTITAYACLLHLEPRSYMIKLTWNSILYTTAIAATGLSLLAIGHTR